jgi:signal transduction histidine kinase
VSASASWIIGNKELTFEVDVAEELPEVESDERWLAHILMNLLANAVKFTPEHGKVVLRALCAEDDETLVLEVEDSGIGIAPEQRQRIFEPFRQLASGDEKGYGGVGLGLALVARLTDLLGATVELDSTVGKGSTFRVFVPSGYRGKRTTKLMHAISPPVDAAID